MEIAYLRIWDQGDLWLSRAFSLHIVISDHTSLALFSINPIWNAGVLGRYNKANFAIAIERRLNAVEAGSMVGVVSGIKSPIGIGLKGKAIGLRVVNLDNQSLTLLQCKRNSAAQHGRRAAAETSFMFENAGVTVRCILVQQIAEILYDISRARCIRYTNILYQSSLAFVASFKYAPGFILPKYYQFSTIGTHFHDRITSKEFAPEPVKVTNLLH